ncbi:hypothetical protein G7068_03195 [Leucobacter viscericola]|uniref:Uncharacterized protein n=1 Tax=Leucobacter viscericola TaxID=2714935 RepID=A0A6G7XCI5_9MICO|nr:hypothetical protein [Leucobacter viscericola]QIK62320.1 hypothetical protein G7068_03195 [Leucobacter viscericola]
MSVGTVLEPDQIPVDPALKPSFKPTKEVTEDQKLWAASVLAELPVAIRFNEHPVKEAKSADGTFWRKAFVIVVIPNKHFSIQLYVGASPSDLEYAQRLVARAKSGWFNSDIWEPHVYPKSGPGFILDPYWEWDGERDCDVLKPCVTPGCIKDFHPYRNGDFNASHELDMIDDTEGRYMVHGSNYEDGDGWNAWLDVDLDGDYLSGAEGVKTLRDSANDMAWMQIECDKLNAAAGVGKVAA